jgi:nucleotide-binding universal stress UspA family protein
LSILGVPATTLIRSGSIANEIHTEVRENGYDLVVMGAPLTNPNGKVVLTGVVGQTLEKITNCSILIVRSHYHRRRFDALTGVKR